MISVPVYSQDQFSTELDKIIPLSLFNLAFCSIFRLSSDNIQAQHRQHIGGKTEFYTKKLILTSDSLLKASSWPYVGGLSAQNSKVRLVRLSRLFAQKLFSQDFFISDLFHKDFIHSDYLISTFIFRTILIRNFFIMIFSLPQKNAIEGRNMQSKQRWKRHN